MWCLCHQHYVTETLSILHHFSEEDLLLFCLQCKQLSLTRCVVYISRGKVCSAGLEMHLQEKRSTTGMMFLYSYGLNSQVNFHTRFYDNVLLYVKRSNNFLSFEVIALWCTTYATNVTMNWSCFQEIRITCQGFPGKDRVLGVTTDNQ